jgi:hypothetical protein
VSWYRPHDREGVRKAFDQRRHVSSVCVQV